MRRPRVDAAVFDDLWKPSLLAGIVKLVPEMQAMITGEDGEKELTLTVPDGPGWEKRQ